MVTLKKLREELDSLKNEILESGVVPEEAKAAGASVHAAVDQQISELNRMVRTMLDEAETTVSDHPVATVAGALALGIAIGRLTSR